MDSDLWVLDIGLTCIQVLCSGSTVMFRYILPGRGRHCSAERAYARLCHAFPVYIYNVQDEKNEQLRAQFWLKIVSITIRSQCCWRHHHHRHLARPRSLIPAVLARYMRCPNKKTLDWSIDLTFGNYFGKKMLTDPHQNLTVCVYIWLSPHYN